MTSIVLPPHRTARTLGVPIREAEVHTAVAAVAAELIPSETPHADFVVAHELELAYGRPDIVAACVELADFRRWRTKRIAPCTAPLPLAAAIALRELNGQATIEELVASDDSAGAKSRLRRSVTTLVDLGWVRRRGDTFILRLEPGAALHSASGVEAKLNNWRRAVRQVQSWEPYVDAVWLAFPATYLKHVPRTPPLRRFGLISVADGLPRVVRRPSGPRARGVRHVLMEQHLYARWLNVTRTKSEASEG